VPQKAVGELPTRTVVVFLLVHSPHNANARLRSALTQKDFFSRERNCTFLLSSVAKQINLQPEQYCRRSGQFIMAEPNIFDLIYQLSETAPLEVISALLKACPGAAKEKNVDNYTPLHSACDSKAPMEVVSALLTAWPDAVNVEDDIFDETPLQLACSIRAPLEIVTALFNTWLSYKDNRTNRAILYLQEDNSNFTGDIEILFAHLFALCHNNTDNHSPREIMDYFIRIQLWNGTTLVLDRNPTVIKTMGLDTKVMADFLCRVGRCCNLTTMWVVLSNEQDLLEGV